MKKFIKMIVAMSMFSVVATSSVFSFVSPTIYKNFHPSFKVVHADELTDIEQMVETEVLGQSFKKDALTDLGYKANVTIDGRGTVMTNDALVINGRTLVPLREISELLGAKVDWNPVSRTATVEKDSKVVSVPLDRNHVVIDGQIVQTDEPGTTINGITYVPLRIVTVALGCNVDWDQETRTVVMQTPIKTVGMFTVEPVKEYEDDIVFTEALGKAVSANTDLKAFANTMKDVVESREEVGHQYKYVQLGATPNTIYDSIPRNMLNSLLNLDVTIENKSNTVKILSDAVGISVLSSYIEILNIEYQTALAKKQIELTTEVLEGQKLMLELGMINQADYDSQIRNYQKMEDGLKINAIALNKEYINLNKLMNLESTTRYNVYFDNVYKPIEDNFDLEHYVSKQKQEAPTVKNAEADIKKAENDLLMYSLNTTRTIDSLRNSISTAEIKHLDIVNNLDKNIRTSYNDLKNLEITIADAGIDLVNAEKAYDTALAQYNVGNITVAALKSANFQIEAAKVKIEALENQHQLVKYTFEHPYLLQ